MPDAVLVQIPCGTALTDLSLTLPALLRCQHRIPDGGRNGAMDAAYPSNVIVVGVDP
jgi:hypothetical protein